MVRLAPAVLLAATSPSEASLAYSDNGSGVVTGHFTPTKSGTYSLMVTVADSSSNITKRNILFFVGTTASQIKRYYYRGIIPTHGQPVGTGVDSKTLLLTAPNVAEVWSCGNWVQSSPDILPTYPLTNLSNIDTYSWYKQTMVAGAYIGIQRYLTYNNIVDSSSAVSDVTKYTWVNKNFADLNWGMDYPWNWYWLSLKIRGTAPSQATFPAAEADADPTSWAAHHHEDGTTDASYADFIYQYTTTPAVKSISNENIVILSATAPTAGSTDYTIVANNPTASNISANIELGSQNKVFSGVDTTTISSDATASIPVSVTTGNTSTVSISPINLALTPSAGTVTVGITTWNTSGDYSKQWTEDGSVHDISTAHTVGSLKTSTSYALSIDGTISDYYIANGSGEITFTYSGGYSAHTFALIEGTAPTPTPTPTPIATPSPSSSATASGTATAATSSSSSSSDSASSSSVDQQGIRLNVITNYKTSDFAFVVGINSLGQDGVTREDTNLTTDKTYDIYDQSPIFRGLTYPNSDITIELTDSSGRKITGKTTSDSDGYWQWQPTEKLSSGEYTVVITVENKNKNINFTSDQYKFKIAENIKASTPALGQTENKEVGGIKAGLSFWVYLIGLIIILSGIVLFVLNKRRRKTIRRLR